MPCRPRACQSEEQGVLATFSNQDVSLAGHRCSDLVSEAQQNILGSSDLALDVVVDGVWCAHDVPGAAVLLGEQRLHGNGHTVSMPNKQEKSTHQQATDLATLGQYVNVVVL